MKEFVISVVTRDRVGVIADACDTIYDLGGNIEALSQTIIQGWFTMLVLVTFKDGSTRHDIKTAIEEAGDYEVIVAPHDPEQPVAAIEGAPFIVTVVGQDQPGIVRALARCFAERGVNIEDVWNEVRDGRFIVIITVRIPDTVDHRDLRYELERIAEPLNVSARLQHQDIFTATNSLQVHTA